MVTLVSLLDYSTMTTAHAGSVLMLGLLALVAVACVAWYAADRLLRTRQQD